MPKGRPPRIDPPMQITVSLPSSLLTKLNDYLTELGERNPPYGVRSALITHLVEEWVAKRDQFERELETARALSTASGRRADA